MDHQALARDAASKYVQCGFYDALQIARFITESIFWQNEVDPIWLHGVIEEAIRLKRAEEKDWPVVTDCDRLDAVFKTLQEEQGILALQNAGYEPSDGLLAVTEFYHQAGSEESGIEGYCFYHGQDLEGVMQYGELRLAFGDIKGEEAKGVEVGKRIKSILEATGFEVHWDGTIETRLLLKGIKWQRRG